MDNPIKLTEKYERNGWPSVKRPDLKLPEGWNLSLLTSLERIRTHALSPDGEAVAYIKDGESYSDVFLLPLNGSWPARISTDRPLAPFWDDETPVWSPDGQWIAFCIKGHVHLVPRAGGLPKKITDFTSSASSPRFMPDSRGLIITVERNEADQLLLTDIEGCWPRALTTDTLGDHWEARPSPDGKHIVYSLRRFDDLHRLDIVLLELETGRSVTLYGKSSTRAFSPKWSPDGKWIAFISFPPDIEKNSHPSYKRVMLRLMPAEGGMPKVIAYLYGGQGTINVPSWSPDSQQIAFVSNSGK